MLTAQFECFFKFVKGFLSHRCWLAEFRQALHNVALDRNMPFALADKLLDVLQLDFGKRRIVVQHGVVTPSGLPRITTRSGLTAHIELQLRRPAVPLLARQVETTMSERWTFFGDHSRQSKAYRIAATPRIDQLELIHFG